MSNGKPRILILAVGSAACMPHWNSNERLRGEPTWTSPSSTATTIFLFTPMLHEVAASDLDITNIVSPIRKLLRRVTFFHGDIESIDLVHKRVGLSHGHEEHCHSLPYDYLVLALGSTTNFFNIPGLAERAPHDEIAG